MVVGISSAAWQDIPDREASLAAGLVLLSDEYMEVIDDYGLSHGTLGTGLARPAAFLIGPDRRVLWRSLPNTWRHRLNARDVLDLYQQQGESR